jgi:hypothetical protein
MSLNRKTRRAELFFFKKQKGRSNLATVTTISVNFNSNIPTDIFRPTVPYRR